MARRTERTIHSKFDQQGKAEDVVVWHHYQINLKLLAVVKDDSYKLDFSANKRYILFRFSFDIFPMP